MPDRLLPPNELISQENEGTTVPLHSWKGRMDQVLPAFNNPRYRVYVSGQLVSLVGTWMQTVAQGWLVLKLTDSAFAIGLIAALGTLPAFFFTLFGGVIVDQFPKKKVLLVTQVTAMLLALVLGLLTTYEIVQVWHIALISFLLGTVNAVDAPARQSFVPELVTKEQLASAIAINSAVFNTARVIGPAIAGMLIAWIGIGAAFLANSFTYIAVITAIATIRIDNVVVRKRVNAFVAIGEGVSYVFKHPIIRNLILFTGVSSVFGWSYTTLLPLIARDTFQMGAAGLGYLYGASGLGSLLATLLIATLSKKVNPIVFIVGGNTLFAASITLFTVTSSLLIALLLMFLVGLGLLAQFAMMNTLIQSLVRPDLRGRVMSIYVFMFIGMMPIGNFEVGWLAEKMGPAPAIQIGALIVFVYGLFVFCNRNKIRESYAKYKQSEN